jgi:lysophospholipase L1-like esterase
MSNNRDSNEAIRALILGDSWIHGLGSERRKSFGRLIARRMGATEILDLSAVSRTVPDVVADHLTTISEFRADIAIVNIGGADSLIFPPWFIQHLVDRFAPSNWHGVEGLQPRALYARTRSRRLRQRIEYVAKSSVKQLSINLAGGRRRIPIADLETAIGTVLHALAEQGVTTVVVGFGQVSHFSSPRTWRSLKQTNRLLHRQAALLPRTIFVPTADFIDCWDDYLPDHVHLNADGHAKVAAGVVGSLEAAGESWAALMRPRPSPALVPSALTGASR